MEDDDLTAEEVSEALDAIENEIGLPNGLPPLGRSRYEEVVTETLGRAIVEDIDRRMMETAGNTPITSPTELNEDDSYTIPIGFGSSTLPPRESQSIAIGVNAGSSVTLNTSEYVLAGENWFCPEHGKIESQYVTFMVGSEDHKFCLKCYVEKITDLGVHRIMTEEQYEEQQKEYKEEIRSIKK